MSDQVFSLEKDEVFDLTKLDPGIKDLYVGLDWDPAVSGEDIDLDAVLIAVGVDGRVLTGKHAECFLFYGNHGRNGVPGAFEVTEDNRDGSDDFNGEIDDDEAIFIYGDKIDANMQELRIFVTFHDAGGRTLRDVSRVGLRIAPLVNGVPDFGDGKMATFDVRNVGASEGAHMASLIRNSVTGWDIKTVGEQSGNLGQVAAAHGLATT
jgi:stress response protein SCP2